MLFMLLAAAAPPLPLTPSTPWNVEAKEDLCVLSRTYGSEGDRTTLLFQPILDMETMDFIVVTPGKPRQQKTGDATIERLPDGRVFKAPYLGLSTLAGGRYVTRISVDRALYDELGQAVELRIKAGPVARQIQVGRSDKAKAAFADCDRDLLKSWGVDPADVTKDRRPVPERNFARYFTSDAYPSAAIEEGFIGRVTAVLNIDAAGIVSKCRPIVSAGKLLTEATCVNAAKLPFRPGHDASGKPVPSIYVLRVRWQLGEATDPGFATRLD